jgi:hypothetical protein
LGTNFNHQPLVLGIFRVGCVFQRYRAIGKQPPRHFEDSAENADELAGKIGGLAALELPNGPFLTKTIGVCPRLSQLTSRRA